MKKAEHLGVWTGGEGRLEVELSMEGTGGQGLCGFLYGGQRAHVGGVAYAVPRARSSGDGITADLSTICGPGHKDVYIAQQLARQLCLLTGETVCITAGLHIDHATASELTAFQQACTAAADKFAEDYKRR